MSAAERIFLLLALGLSTSVVLAMFAFTGGAKTRVARRAAKLSRRARGADAEQLTLRRAGESPFEATLHRLLGRPEALRERLARTGRRITLPVYVLASVAVAAVAALSIVLAGFSPGIALPGGLLVGVWLPHLAVAWLINRRSNRFMALFPEAIGLIVRGLKSGLPVTESMGIVGREVSDPVGEEFRRVTDQIRLGQAIEAAMWEAARRVGLTEFNFLVITMSVQRETGGNLAETLENLDQVLRRRRQLKLKIKAMSSEARASAMIIGCLPFAMFAILFVVNRDYIMTLLTTSSGHMLLSIGGASLLIGFGVMARMVRFEI